MASKNNRTTNITQRVIQCAFIWFSSYN